MLVIVSEAAYHCFESIVGLLATAVILLPARRLTTGRVLMMATVGCYYCYHLDISFVIGLAFTCLHCLAASLVTELNLAEVESLVVSITAFFVDSKLMLIQTIELGLFVVITTKVRTTVAFENCVSMLNSSD